MKNVGNNKKGFTIIEVVLVLAIAGLIFLIVFLAVPALQRGQRDTQRRSDLSRFVAQLDQYAANNNGAYPSTQAQVDSFRTGYITNNGASFNDPSGTAYTVTYTSTAPTSSTAIGNISYSVGQRCGADGAFTGAAGNRNVAASVKTENGTAYCQDNQ